MRKIKYNQAKKKLLFLNSNKELALLANLTFKNNLLITKILRQKSSFNLDSGLLFYSKLFSYCLVTGRVRFTLKKTSMSRQLFKNYLELGALPGYFFSSW